MSTPRGRDGARTVIIGGTGFVGRHIRAAFATAGHDVLIVARNSVRDLDGHRFVALDLAEPAAGSALRDLLAAERPDVVVNAAGAVWSPTERELRESNIAAVQQLIGALCALPEPPRLIHLGSVNEYAPMPPGVAVDENAPLRPVTRYGRSKLIGSTLVLRAMAENGLRGLVLRLANVAGPGLPAVSLLGRVAQQLGAPVAAGKRATVRLHTMRARRDFVDYQDAAQAIVAAAMVPASGQAVNIGRGEAVSVQRLVGLLISVSGIAADVVLEQPAVATGVVPEAEWLRVDPRTAAELLGWRSRRHLEDSVRDLWDSRDSRDGRDRL